MTPGDWKAMWFAIRFFASVLTLLIGIACVVKALTLGPTHDLHLLYVGVGMTLFAIVARDRIPKE